MPGMFIFVLFLSFCWQQKCELARLCKALPLDENFPSFTLNILIVLFSLAHSSCKFSPDFRLKPGFSVLNQTYGMLLQQNAPNLQGSVHVHKCVHVSFHNYRLCCCAGDDYDNGVCVYVSCRVCLSVFRRALPRMCVCQYVRLCVTMCVHYGQGRDASPQTLARVH